MCSLWTGYGVREKSDARMQRENEMFECKGNMGDGRKLKQRKMARIYRCLLAACLSVLSRPCSSCYTRTEMTDTCRVVFPPDVPLPR